MLILAESHWFWLLLPPLATAGAALLVYRGVRATLKQNWERLKAEHDEKRTTDRYTTLFNLYGDFYAAASDYLMNMNTLIPTQTLLVSERPINLVTGVKPDEESLRRRIRLEDHADELRKVCLAQQAAMQAALSRLSLMNDLQSRLRTPLEDIVRVNNITVNSTTLELNNLRLDLRRRQHKLGYDLAMGFNLATEPFVEIVD